MFSTYLTFPILEFGTGAVTARLYASSATKEAQQSALSISVLIKKTTKKTDNLQCIKYVKGNNIILFMEYFVYLCILKSSFLKLKVTTTFVFFHTTCQLSLCSILSDANCIFTTGAGALVHINHPTYQTQSIKCF